MLLCRHFNCTIRWRTGLRRHPHCEWLAPAAPPQQRLELCWNRPDGNISHLPKDRLEEHQLPGPELQPPLPGPGRCGDQLVEETALEYMDDDETGQQQLAARQAWETTSNHLATALQKVAEN